MLIVWVIGRRSCEQLSPIVGEGSELEAHWIIDWFGWIVIAGTQNVLLELDISFLFLIWNTRSTMFDFGALRFDTDPNKNLNVTEGVSS